MILRPPPRRIGIPGNQLASMIPGLAGEVMHGLVLGGIAPAIAITTAISCISLVTQGLADGAWPNLMIVPLGNNSIVVGTSGSGKTFTFKTLSDPIARCVEERFSSEPKLNAKPLFFVEDATREAIILHLLEWPIAALATDEAGQLKRLLQTGSAAVAKLVDGTPLHHARVTTGRASLKEHRLLIFAMMQPDVFEECKAAFGIGKGGVGLINRCYVGNVNTPPTTASISTLGLSANLKARYDARTMERARQTIELIRARRSRAIVPLSPAATQRFLFIANEMKSIQYDANFSGITEYVSRHCERILHTAGSLHVYENGPQGEVQLESLEAAHQIGLWSIDNYADLTAAKPKPTQIEIDSKRLDAELAMVANRYGQHLALTPLRRMVANIGLTRSRFDRALPVLADAGRIVLYTRGREDMIFVQLPYAPWLDFGKRS